ncbi:MAG: type II secretion system minor pseudopilin GspH [Sedimenticola sp.]
MQLQAGNRTLAIQKGFTLLELLVVVLIIGLVSGFATLSVGSIGSDRQLKTEAQRIVHRFTLAMQESILQGRPVGVTLNPTGYGFLVALRDGWAAPDTGFSSRGGSLPETWRLVKLAGENAGSNLNGSKQNNRPVPDLLFLPTGEISPFELRLHDPNAESHIRITGLASGQINFETVRGGL